MGCQHVGDAIVCSRGRRRVKCSVVFCHKAAVAYCDYPVERDGLKTTCDSPMCGQHRYRVAGEPDMDWCQGHWNYEQRQHQRDGYSGAEQE